MWAHGVVAALLVSAALAAQGAAEFDVASIKANTSGESGSTFDLSRGQLRAVNVPIQPLIRQAFEVMDTQIVGAPSWVETDRYDILAKAPEGMTTAVAMRPLLRALLADRFKLATHRERRDMPVFALVRARADRFGPGFRTTVDCAATAQPGGPATPPAPSQEEWPCSTVRFTPGQLYIGGYPMAEVMRLLAPLVGRTLVDETGTPGPVYLRLSYRPQGRSAQAPDAALDDRPDLFTALEEQTGLKLDSRRAPVDVLVIDAIDRPAAD
jgi:uncharacterized protein (TIGR03435 family)